MSWNDRYEDETYYPFRDDWGIRSQRDCTRHLNKCKHCGVCVEKMPANPYWKTPERWEHVRHDDNGSHELKCRTPRMEPDPLNPSMCKNCGESVTGDTHRLIWPCAFNVAEVE